ncbi:murein hydrolase activator EnvC family protein [Bartonella ancashensis]|uniref:murein hydrolase activator EnvC family protein n=1 Tax=Bartonella ancashensis TaxID=1318743 RepID=UPI0009E8A3E3|nr:peptidoglycan DD-metalloendopeptidase family protein [Bartonella ancashensis]
MLSIVCFLSFLDVRDIYSVEVTHETLEEVYRDISLSREQILRLTKKVDDLKKDKHILTNELIKVAKAERDAVASVAETEKKLKKLVQQQTQSHQKLKDHRDEFVEVLSILERIGLDLPPAIIARPEDVLASIRSSVLLENVIPQMQEKIQDLTKRLRELNDLARSITKERTALALEIKKQVEQRKHLELLLDEKAKLQKISEKELTEQQQRNVRLAEKSQSLEELILELNHQSQVSSDLSVQMQENLQLLRNLDFENQKGALLSPVAGKKIQQFKNGSYATRFGEIIETEAAAVVLSPVNALVVFSGLFRSYGQLVILDVGSGYHIVFVGMARTGVKQGQFVLSGEPIGMMGTRFVASTLALDVGKNSPMLYIEFRKDGKPVNPTPWWRTERSKRNKNDS